MFVRNADTPRLIKQAQAGDKNALDRLVRENMGLVKSIAIRFRDRYEIEDLTQIGVVGLIKAIRGFSFEKETVLSTYAVPLITGEIKRFLRDDGTVKVSRELKARGRAVLKAKEKYLAENETEPTVSQLAALCSLTEEQTLEALDCALPIISFSAEQGEKTVEDFVGEDCMSPINDRIAVAQAVEKLVQDEKILIECRFYKGMSQAQTGVVLGYTQVKVSRKEKQILQKLKEMLE